MVINNVIESGPLLQIHALKYCRVTLLNPLTCACSVSHTGLFVSHRHVCGELYRVHIYIYSCVANCTCTCDCVRVYARGEMRWCTCNWNDSRAAFKRPKSHYSYIAFCHRRRSSLAVMVAAAARSLRRASCHSQITISFSGASFLE